MPFIGTGMVIWNYLSQVITECTSIFVNHKYIYQNQRMNFAVSICSVIYKNTLILAHSFIIILIIIVIFSVPVNLYLFQIIPSPTAHMDYYDMVWVSHCNDLRALSRRNSDYHQLAAGAVFTPVMWKPAFLPSHYRFLIDYNPLSQFLEILRDPFFLGQPASSYAWLSTIVIAFGGAVLALPLIGRYHRRVIFWM